MNNKGYETKEIENQSESKNFRVNLILTSEIFELKLREAWIETVMSSYVKVSGLPR